MTTAQTTEVVDTSAADAAAAAAIAKDAEPVDAETEYDRLFDERVAAREAEKSGTKVDAGTKEATPVAEEQKQESKTDAAKTEDVDAATVDEKKDEKKDDTVTVIEPDWVKELPEARRPQAMAAVAAAAEAEELRKANAKVMHDNRSMVGRMSAYQRKYEEAAGKKPVDVAKAETAEQKETWKQFTEDYPDIAKAFEARLEGIQPGGSADIKAMTEFMQKEMQTRFLTEAYEAVDAIHPDWRAQAKTKEFAEWKGSSPAYEKLASSDDVADAVALFDLWDAHRSKTAPTKPVADAAGAAEAAKLAARRDAQAEGGKAAATTKASPNQGVDLSQEDQQFALYAQQANARMAKRHQ